MSCRFEYSENSEKANDYMIEWLKQVVTIAGALLVLSITFLKDILNDNTQHACGFFLLPFGWAFLFLSLWWGLTAIADGARRLGTGEVSGYAFSRNTPCAFSPRRIARLAHYTLLLGIFSLGLFVILNVSHAVKENLPDHSTATATTTTKIVIK